jgi:hypothetical protein
LNSIDSRTLLEKRLRPALKFALLHFLCSISIAGLAAIVVFVFWFPYPYRELSGGRELFTLIVLVDVVCGPLLTAVLFNPTKSRRELSLDMSIVVTVQLMALFYGMWTVWQARPIYLVAEIDRFKVIHAPNLPSDFSNQLPVQLRPNFFSKPLVIGIRSPKDEAEKQEILFSTLRGGPDYAERPEFYVPYEGDAIARPFSRARSLSIFLKRYPDLSQRASEMAIAGGAALKDLKYLPIIARQDWIAVLDSQGKILGYLKGDGF